MPRHICLTDGAKRNSVTNLSQTQRQFLRKIAHELKPIVQVGKNGLSESLLASAAIALDTHELIKVKFYDYKDEKRDLADAVASQLGAELIGLIGNTAILYRRNPDDDKRKINLPRE